MQASGAVSAETKREFRMGVGVEGREIGLGCLYSYSTSVLWKTLLVLGVEQFQAGKNHCQAMCRSEFVGTPSEDQHCCALPTFGLFVHWGERGKNELPL